MGRVARDPLAVSGRPERRRHPIRPLSTWAAERGRFPVRDTIFSDEVFEAIYFPPWNSLEALAGTVAGATGISAPSLVYLGVTPLATVLAVLAIWRLLRRWEVPMPAVALSTALIFLLVAGSRSTTRWGGSS
jgi:hypothetical protein